MGMCHHRSAVPSTLTPAILIKDSDLYSILDTHLSAFKEMLHIAFKALYAPAQASCQLDTNARSHGAERWTIVVQTSQAILEDTSAFSRHIRGALRLGMLGAARCDYEADTTSPLEDGYEMFLQRWLVNILDTFIQISIFSLSSSSAQSCLCMQDAPHTRFRCIRL